MEEWALIIVPLSVAALGLIQVVINVMAGRRANQAASVRDHAAASHEIGEAYGGLVEALQADNTTLRAALLSLEERVSTLEREREDLEAWAEALEAENLALRHRIRQLEQPKEVDDDPNPNPSVRPGDSEPGDRGLPSQASEEEVP